MIPETVQVHTRSISLPVTGGFIDAKHLFYAQERLLQDFNLEFGDIRREAPRSNISLIFHHDSTIKAVILEARFYTNVTQLR